MKNNKVTDNKVVVTSKADNSHNKEYDNPNLFIAELSQEMFSALNNYAKYRLEAWGDRVFNFGELLRAYPFESNRYDEVITHKGVSFTMDDLLKVLDKNYGSILFTSFIYVMPDKTQPYSMLTLRLSEAFNKAIRAAKRKAKAEAEAEANKAA